MPQKSINIFPKLTICIPSDLMFSYVIIAVWLSRGEKGMMKIEKKIEKTTEPTEKNQRNSHTQPTAQTNNKRFLSRARALIARNIKRLDVFYFIRPFIIFISIIFVYFLFVVFFILCGVC